MKLLVIVLCLISERYLTHSIAQHRFSWFLNYNHWLNNRFGSIKWLNQSYIYLSGLILPIILLFIAFCYLFNTLLFGFGELLIDLVTFYYCLGPMNPFYPQTSEINAEGEVEAEARHYLYAVNNQLFAVIFWFVLTGPVGLLCYRLLSLSSTSSNAKQTALLILAYLDWITVRLTLLWYMLAGNFQRGLSFFCQHLFAPVQNNQLILATGGLKVAKIHNENQVTLTDAQNLVEYSLIIYLAFIGLFTLASWL